MLYKRGRQCKTSILVLAGLCWLGYSARPFDSLHYVGNCGNEDIGLTSSSYWARFVAAGNLQLNFNSIECCDPTLPSDEAKYMAAIDILIAQRAAGSNPLLFTQVDREMYQEQHALRAAAAGIAVFLLAGEPLENWPSMDASAVSAVLNSTETTMLQFLPNEAMAADHHGQELCRVMGGVPQRVAVAYPPVTTRDNRINDVITAFKYYCPDSHFEVVAEFRGDWGREAAAFAFRPIFIADPAITTVICANDQTCEGVLQAADRTLGASSRSVALLGYDYGLPYRDYIWRKRFLSTVDWLVDSNSTWHSSYWNTVTEAIGLLEVLENTSTTYLRSAFRIDSNIVRTSVIGISSDPDGYMLHKLLTTAAYASTARAVQQDASDPTEVLVSVFGLHVREFGIATFSATFWLQAEWQDIRLQWPESQYNGTLHWPADSIWIPDVTVTNIVNSEDVIYTSPVDVTMDGWVRLRVHIQGTFTCAMNTAPHPYNIHRCSIDITASGDTSEVLLKPKDFKISRGPEGYRSLEVLQATVQQDDNFDQLDVVFQYKAVKKTSFTMWAYVITTSVLNIISFSQLYIPPRDDRTGLGLTTVLTAMVLQMEARVSAVTTWLDIFLTISLFFQFSAFLVSVVARRTIRKYYKKEDPDSVAELNSEFWLLKEANFLERILVLIMGSPLLIAEDRWSRRLQVPLFGIIMILLSFCWIGNMDITEHPEHGLHCPLFWIGLGMTLPFPICFLVWPFWMSKYKRAVAIAMDKYASEQRKDHTIKQEVLDSPSFRRSL
mmetsp:Transcript_15621/g.36566  ORF Transcript_15621/g.36566 Transcript_15621/m.36566 type:complete len:778 (-) Transcript_15621:197-2530(-)